VVEGDLLVHFAGKGDTKKARMMKFMTRTAQHGKLSCMTEYQKEIEEFWKVWAQVESAGEIWVCRCRDRASRLMSEALQAPLGQPGYGNKE